MTESPNNFRFRDWPVYRDSRTLRKNVMALVKTFPAEERYALSDQTRRALNSILLNLAEGSNKNTDKDTRVFVNRSQGSLDEVVSCMDCALDDGYINENQHTRVLKEAHLLAKQLKGFSVYLALSVKDKGLKIKD
ncbi:MAG: hypothetical protein A2W52_00605 [Candidatus Taylorbacteria bacterium RIFCSPHIGHO2_02_49_25]|uniref:Four helix bundle protein n=1 Tax=Candidatus Taylorbacteria bacterium RIFCSPHIGHO2_02_49_25 TaxID=1802305 RepID=A0A1G2MEY3_9BACT|nr:MAG: 23S ribosomal protein [Parcubacteria group bacterium GW2011_GWF2_50_9]OHA21279.1 MAG: hypothetical protein A2759_04185 [Candidatus Taylorbacteria bacterium RIFCSPHIGHO2_01_FULL_49_60]OHA22475.1 MAG: hypothetical protein A2W52_00605 [Candidatus Taylorbacteria bacterium RIFCSPHIGHO2_02_49_25]OHA36466.1 MAG: hypothetical protein A2W65_04640 [Candidatus Taylorbacteria bacterium RIFCSPLOWO2_02_50_13]OHA37197.1 MAG: hypothetical protein A3B27_02780 [Candidatus Taylorbacteria bacterium RIFCSPL